MATVRTLLVTGATGQQSRALISSLLASAESTNQHFRILALTRDPSSSAAQSLLSSKGGTEVVLVKGNLDDPASVRTVFENAEGGIWGVYAVLAFPGLGEAGEEEKQGTLLADLSLEFGVEHFVYSSAERGGEIGDDNRSVFWAGKVNIERHVKALGAKGLKWTILRPGIFMEIFNGITGKLAVAVMRCGLKPTTKVQLIAIEDVGHVAATVLQHPDNHLNEVVVVVGDVLSPKEQDEAHRRATGRPLPSVPTFLAKLGMWLNPPIRGLISDWEGMHSDRSSMDGGYEAILQDIRAIHPETMSFEEWSKKRAGRAVEYAEGWNKVTLLGLIMGKH